MFHMEGHTTKNREELSCVDAASYRGRDQGPGVVHQILMFWCRNDDTIVFAMFGMCTQKPVRSVCVRCVVQLMLS